MTQKEFDKEIAILKAQYEQQNEAVNNDISEVCKAVGNLNKDILNMKLLINHHEERLRELRKVRTAMKTNYAIQKAKLIESFEQSATKATID